MARKLVAWDDTNDRFVRTTVDPDSITTGLTLDKVLAGSTAIPNGATTVTCPYGDTFAGQFAVGVMMTNIVDDATLIQPVNITQRNGGSVETEWNMPVDSANYRMDFIAVEPCLQYRANTGSFGSSSTTTTINMASASTLGTPVTPEYQDLGKPQYFDPLLITAKSGAGFSVDRPTSMSSDVYLLYALGSNISCTGVQAGISTLPSGVSAATISFPFPRLDTVSYAVIATMENLVDSEPLFIVPTVVTKGLSGFTVELSHPTNSANYTLSWVAQSF